MLIRKGCKIRRGRKERMMDENRADREEEKIGEDCVKNEEMTRCQMKRKDREGLKERCGSFL